MDDYYQILNISPTSSIDDIKQSYRKLALKYHPDKNKGNKLAEKMFQKISSAYNVLSHIEKRKFYDKQRYAYQQAQTYRAHSAVHTASQPETSQPSPTSSPSLDASVQLSISFEEAHKGCSKQITFEKKHNSSIKKQKLSIHIPKGIPEGKHLRLKEQSHQFQSKKGDLFIEVKMKKHPLFSRIKNDLFMQLPISITDAVLGKKMTIPTLTGQAHISVPPGAYSGQLLKLKNQGFYLEDSPSRGDFILEIKIDIPSKITEEDKQWFKEFRKKEDIPSSVAQFNIQTRKLLLQRAS